MAEENINKKTGAERQAEVLVAALERANKNGGTLLNAGQKAMPQFYDKTLRITPVNALIMAMHSDNGEFKTNSYTMFNETHDRSEAVKKGQKGVPFVWQNLNQYVNKDNAEDKISRAEYKSLADAEKAKYKVNPREDVYTVFINPAKRNVLDLKNETCKNREKRNVLKISHTRHFKTTKSSPKRAAFIVLNGKQTAFK